MTEFFESKLELTEEGKKAFQRSCLDCDKFNVCYIWRDLQMSLVRNNLPEQKLPIELKKLAVICSLYYPKGKESV